ncbi:MAG: hypothetical protein V4632_08475 [Pseudomonadota bacterium]
MPDPSFFIPLFLQSAALPFGVALVLLFVLRASRAGVPLAIAAAFLASYFAVLHQQWSLAPKQAIDWMPCIVVLAAAGVAAAERSATTIRRLLRLLTSVAISAIVAWPALASSGMQNTAMTIVLMGACIWAAWTTLARSADSSSTPPVLLTIVAGGAALALMLDASQLIGQLTGGLAAALMAFLALNMRRLPGAFSGAATGLTVLLLGALLGYAYIYAGFSLTYIALLASGLLAGTIIDTVRGDGRAASWLPAALLAIVPVMLVLGLAIKAAQDAGGY